MIIIIIILICIIAYLAYKLNQKMVLETSQQDNYNKIISQLANRKDTLEKDIAYRQEVIKNYDETIEDQQNTLDRYFDDQRAIRQKDLDHTYEIKKSLIDQQLNQYEQECNDNIESLKRTFEAARETYDKQIYDLIDAENAQRERYQALIEPIRQFEMQQEERLFYTVQTPEEYREDINFLLTTVSQKVQHPDIISKLIWAEYVKPYIDETFKRIAIKDEPGIYKLTNINNGKAYVGKSTNVKKRIADHFKSAIGIQAIADQRVHHEMLKTGIWNWTIEIVTYCEKEKLSELEKYYIDFFKTQEWGYNRNAGG